jgi:hypothetical protein
MRNADQHTKPFGNSYRHGVKLSLFYVIAHPFRNLDYARGGIHMC